MSGSLPLSTPAMIVAPAERLAPARALPFITFNGRTIPRVKGFVTRRRIRCPADHVVNEPARFLEDGTIYCDHRAAKGERPCQALIYILVLPGRGARRRVWAADCTREEIDEIERLGLDADGILEYFGAGFTR